MLYKEDRNAEMRSIIASLSLYLLAIVVLGGGLTLLLMWIKS